MSKKNFGILCVLFSGLFFGLIGYFGLNAMNANLSVYTMLLWRFIACSLFIFAMLLPQLKILTRHPVELFKIFLYGVVFYSATSIFYFLASYHLGSGLAMVIFFTYPAMVMFINRLVYRSKVSKTYLLSLLVLALGMLLLMNGSSGKFNVLGIVFSLLSALFYALYVVVSKKSPVAPLPSTFVLSMGCILTCFIAAMIDNSLILPSNSKAWINIGGIGIICTALPIFFLLKGLKYLSSTQASILSVLEPVFVVIFGITLLGESINLVQFVGITALLGGALISLLNDNPKLVKNG